MDGDDQPPVRLAQTSKCVCIGLGRLIGLINCALAHASYQLSGSDDVISALAT